MQRQTKSFKSSIQHTNRGESNTRWSWPPPLPLPFFGTLLWSWPEFRGFGLHVKAPVTWFWDFYTTRKGCSCKWLSMLIGWRCPYPHCLTFINHWLKGGSSAGYTPGATHRSQIIIQTKITILTAQVTSFSATLLRSSSRLTSRRADTSGITTNDIAETRKQLSFLTSPILCMLGSA